MRGSICSCCERVCLCIYSCESMCSHQICVCVCVSVIFLNLQLGTVSEQMCPYLCAPACVCTCTGVLLCVCV